MYINSIDSFPFWGLWPGVCSFPAIRDLVEDELLENIIFFFNIWKVCYKICISYNMNCLLKVITNIRFSYMNFFLYFCPLYKCDITTFFRIMVAFILIYECYYSNGLSFFSDFRKFVNMTWTVLEDVYLMHF